MLPLLAVLAGCASTSVELMLGTEISAGFDSSRPGPTATFRLRQTINERTFCEYEHVSSLLSGPPFDPAGSEDWLDQVGCGIRFGGN